MNCKYTLTLNGKVIKAGVSEDEIYSYIRATLPQYKAMKLGLFGDIVFDEATVRKANVVSQIMIESSKLASKIKPTELDIISEEFDISSPKALSVTKAINTWRADGRRLVPEYNEENYIKNETERLIKDGMSRDEADKVVRERIKNFPHIAKIGEKVHKVAEIFFSKDLDNSLIFDTVDLPRTTLENLVSSFSNLKAEILKNGDVEFLPELTFETTDSESEPVIGRIDLITVSDSGRIGIYDFKISTKEYNDWSSAKKLSVDYQLAAYRALLANKGLPVQDASLNVIPIVVEDPNYEEESFNSFRFDATENRLTSNYTNLNWRSGKYSKNIREHIKSTLPEVNITPRFTSDVSRLSEAAFGKITHLTVEDFENSYVRKNRSTGEYYFLDYIHEKKGESYTEVSAPSKSELRPKIEQYLAEKDIYDQEAYYQNIYDQIQILKESGKTTDEGTLFRSKEGSVHAYLLTTFAPFIDNPNFELLEIPEFARMGIYAFKDDQTGIISFITLTNVDTRHKLKLKYDYDSILSNIASSPETKGYKKVLTATAGNAKILETVLAINSLPAQFQNYKIGNILVVNHKLGQSDYISPDQLDVNFNFLAKHLGIENHFKSGLLNFADPLESIKTSLLTLIAKNRTEKGLSVQNKIYDLYANKSLSNMTGENKINLLRKLQDLIVEAHPQGTYNNINANNYTDPYELLHAKISQLIMYYNNVYFNFDHDISEFGVNILDMRKSLGVTGYIFENPEMTDNPVMKYIVDLTELGFQKIRIRYHDYKQQSLKRVLKLYDSKGLSQVERWTVRDAARAFDNMFERDSANGITSRFRVKNPYNPNSTLSSEERAWLKQFLWNINKMRSVVSPEYRSLTEEQAIKIEAIQDLIHSGEYFDVPLVQGDLFSKLRGRNYRDWIRDEFNQAADIRNILKSQEKDINEQVENYTKMYNFLDISTTRREQLLAEKDVGYWETNLELVEDIFVHAAARKEVFDDLLPFIQDARVALNLYAFDGKIPIDTLKRQIDLYVRTVIFNEPGPKGDEKRKALRWINTGSALARSTMLALNINSLMREPFQGFWMLASRAMTGVLGKDAFKAKDLAWAYMKFMGDAGGPFSDNYSILEHLNMIYGMTRMDVNGLAHELNNSNRMGLKALRRAPYWSTTAPDFLNRMIFLTAQMKHDGCFEAHHLVDGELVYNWKEDKRYSEFTKGNKSHPDYENQKANYYAHLIEFNKEGYNLKYNPENPEALPLAYTTVEKRNIKSGADSLFGYMDHENAMPIRNMLLGKLLTQFQMYFSSTKERWANGQKDKTSKGEWVHKRNEAGELLYLKEVYNEETGEYDMIETTEETSMKAMEWNGRFIEGMVNSLFWFLKYAWKRGWNDPNYTGREHIDYRKRNVGQLALDLAWRALLAQLLVLWFKQQQEANIEAGERMNHVARQLLEKSTTELTPGAVITPLINFNAPALDAITNLTNGFMDVLTGDKTVGSFIKQNVAAVRTIELIAGTDEDNEL